MSLAGAGSRVPRSNGGAGQVGVGHQVLEVAGLIPFDGRHRGGLLNYKKSVLSLQVQVV